MFAGLLLGACATKMTVVPPMDPLTKVEFRIPGQIVYEGKPEYLPRTLVEGPAGSGLILRYTFDVAYGKDRTDAAAHLYNPLVMFGFPIGEDTVAVVGTLLIERRGEAVKTYTATCGFAKTRNLFSEGETYSGLRLRGLACVRDNIEAQMHTEREFLSRLATLE